MKEYILITGASSGIGLEIAEQLAAKKFNLILVARNEEKLQHLQLKLSNQYQVDVDFIVFDLAETNAAQDLYNEIKDKNYVISGLINNAGFGDYGQFVDMPLGKDYEMIAVNVSSLVGLTKLFAADMVKRKNGKIMNIASLLSYLPFPYYAVYSATKSFVLSFTETIAAELQDHGVIVTALCPGPVETAFHTDAMRKTVGMSTNKPMSAKKVAEAGISLFLYGKGKKVVGFMNKILSQLPRITPDNVMMAIKKHLASIK